MGTIEKNKKFESDALTANLLETSGDVVIRQDLKLLLDIFSQYKGLHKSLDELFVEICHPYRNWKLLIPQLRSFVLKNSNHFIRHKHGGEAFRLIADLFFEAIDESTQNNTLLATTIEAILAWVDKMVVLFSEEELDRFALSLNYLFAELILRMEKESQVGICVVQGQHPMKKLAKRLLALGRLDYAGNKFDYHLIAALMRKVLNRNYNYWLSEVDPLRWLEDRFPVESERLAYQKILSVISHELILSKQNQLKMIDYAGRPMDELSEMLSLPSHVDFVRSYKNISEELSSLEIEIDGSVKLLFLFKIMDTSGLYLIHEDTLREINRTLVKMIKSKNFDEIEGFLLTTFQLLKTNVRRYPHTSLHCIQAIGGEVFERGSSRMVEAFLWQVVRFGFQYSNVVGIDEDWHPISNPAHLGNIRTWLRLIMQEPKWCSTLFSALIINIKLSGTCVKDTDLFQRDITELLNHPIEPIYNLTKQFSKLMPVFFNEIGAEGELREVSTELDEIHKRRDPLIHFLRKQSHVESSNLIVDFIQAILDFWHTKNKKPLNFFLPEEVYKEISLDGKFVDEQNLIINRIYTQLGFDSLEDILSWDNADRQSFLNEQVDISIDERRRFNLIVQMYKLLHQKYNLGFQELRLELQHAAASGFPEMENLVDVLLGNDTEKCLKAIFDRLEELKETILSEEHFEVEEEISHKRHIAVDIPSVYGRYSERKFNSLGLTFRLENLANIYLEKLPELANLSFITQQTFYRVVRCLKFYLRALRIDGIGSRRLDTSLALLKSSLRVRRFTYTQYLDIFRGLSEGVKDVIYTHYINNHQTNLSIAIPQIGAENLLTKYRFLWDDNNIDHSVHRLSEAFYRDLIATTFGLQHLDNFITRIMQTMENQRSQLDTRLLDLLMTYNPEKTVSSLHNVNPYTNNLIHLGNKGFNLVTLATDNKPVPPGFVLTTELFRCREVINKVQDARDELMRRIRRSLTEVETRSGKKFGDPVAPLLLSIRSGAAVSMPGMMATILNVGLNQDIIEDYILSGGKAVFAWDNYRRFLQSWAMTSGMLREEFQRLMDQAKEKHQVRLKRQFTGDQMKELALSYLRVIELNGFNVPDDPWLQLVSSVSLVIDSWKTVKAEDYRKVMDLSESWGTAAIVQEMVFGNKDENGGSGVLFTAHPYRKLRRVALWGDYIYGDQGDDIVSGLVTSCAVSVEQAEIDGRLAEETLERRFPEIYDKLKAISRELVYDKGWDPQEIEFTFEGPRSDELYILQSRDMFAIKEKEHIRVFVEDDSLKNNYLGKGIGVSGSALSGRAVFTEEDIKAQQEKDPDANCILIRQDTVPEDIKVIDMADGLLTARGGQTSHASVVAVRLNKTCVVGCEQLKVFESGEYCEINGRRIETGDYISLDGRQGVLFLGMHPIKDEVHILPI